MGNKDLVEIKIYFGDYVTIKNIRVDLYFEGKLNDTNVSDDTEVTKDKKGILTKRGLAKDGTKQRYDDELPATRLRSDTNGKVNIYAICIKLLYTLIKKQKNLFEGEELYPKEE